MKKFLKSNLSKEKVAKFFDKEGFYIVLFLCVCIVAITAVWVSRTGIKNGESQDMDGVKDNKAAVTTPVKEVSTPGANSSSSEKPKITVTEEGKASKQEIQNQQSAAKKDSTSSTKSEVAVSSIKFDSPIKDGLKTANIIRDYSPEDLVCFESLNEWRTHLGLDIKSPEGAEVLAVYSGKVVDIRNDNDLQGGLGWTVVVDHGNGYQSVYANLNEKIDVKKNQTVKKGQTIGVVGRSTIFESTALEETGEYSHLHFEVLRKSAKTYEKVDPKNYLTLQK